MSENTFVLTEEHLKLMKAMVVGWCDDEYGAPEINPKRPYGNSDVANDIMELLNWNEFNDMSEEDKEDFYESTQYAYLCECAERIHAETETALQIALLTGEFKVGTYIRSKSWLDDWKLMS